MGIPADFDKEYRKRFKELLLPQGFQYKQDMFIRVVNGEIIQLITRLKRDPFYYIRFGVQSIYSSEIKNFEQLKAFCSSELSNCINNSLEITGHAFPEPPLDWLTKDTEDNYCIIRDNDVKTFFTRAVRLTKSHLLPIFQNINNMNDLVSFQKRTTHIWFLSVNDLIILRDQDDLEKQKKLWLSMEKEMYEQERYGDTYEEGEKRITQGFCHLVETRDKVLNDSDLLTKADKENRHYAEVNLKSLRSWGIKC